MPDIPDLPDIPDTHDFSADIPDDYSTSDLPVNAIKPDIFPDFTPHIDDSSFDSNNLPPIREDSFIPDFFKARKSHCEDVLHESLYLDAMVRTNCGRNYLKA